MVSLWFAPRLPQEKVYAAKKAYMALFLYAEFLREGGRAAPWGQHEVGRSALWNSSFSNGNPHPWEGWEAKGGPQNGRQTSTNAPKDMPRFTVQDGILVCFESPP